MFLLLLLPILVSGYLVFTFNPYYFYRLHRYEGQLLYIATACNGLICTFLGAMTVLIINKNISCEIHIFGLAISLDILSPLESLIGNNSALSTSEKVDQLDGKWLSLLILTNLSSCAIAVLWGRLAKIWLAIKVTSFKKGFKNFAKICKNPKRIYFIVKSGKRKLLKSPVVSIDERSRILLMSGILKDTPMDKLFLSSYINEEQIMLSLADRKVYVGCVISLGEPNEAEGMDQEIEITPFLSGYRDKDTLQLLFTTQYSDLEEVISIVIKQDQIVAATKFDIDRYIKIQNKL